MLNYHSVGGRPGYLTTSQLLFAEQMLALKLGGFHTVTMAQYAAYVRGDTAGLPARPILLTFDDGRLDAYRAATLTLQQDGFHAVELAVPGWITTHPAFSLNWAELAQMNSGTTWSVQPHFGYGSEKVRIDAAGDLGGTFAYQQYLPGGPGQPGHLETFAQFTQRFTNNELFGLRQLTRLPNYQPLATAIPTSNYGQNGTNDPRIPPYVLSWLDHHFTVVFGGDYLDEGNGRFQIPGRFSPQLSYRWSMGPNETLAAFHCRLIDFVEGTSIQAERRCLQPPHALGRPSSR